jgi:hypothetical protein
MTFHISFHTQLIFGSDEESHFELKVEEFAWAKYGRFGFDGTRLARRTTDGGSGNDDGRGTTMVTNR